MPLRTLLRRALPLLLCALPLPAFAAASLSGTITNKTTGKPSAGDDVVLIRLQQTMEETTRTKTDARGHYVLQVPEDGMHLVRVTHDKASYFQPVQPGTTTVNLDVYDAAPHIEGVSTDVEELHVEATATELHIVEVLQVLNQSSPARTQFGPDGFDFYLPPAAHILRTSAQRDGMPVPASATPAGDPGHYTFLFPIRPGETQFGIFYTLPYSGQATLDLKLIAPVATVAVMLPHTVQFKSAGQAPWKISQQGEQGGSQMWTVQNAGAGQTVSFTISGTGTLPADGPQSGSTAAPSGAQASGQPIPETQNTAPGKGLQNPLDPEGDRDPWGKYKWWILTGLGLLLAVAAGILLKKPTNATAPGTFVPPPSPGGPFIGPSSGPMSGGAGSHAFAHNASLDALKEELFSLETDHLQQRISEREYLEHKAALELVLRRVLARNGGSVPSRTEPYQETGR